MWRSRRRARSCTSFLNACRSMWMSGADIPRLRRSLPAERAPRPQGIQAVDHPFEQRLHGLTHRIGERVQPGAVLAVLPFELAVEARITRRPMQHEHLMFFEDLLHERAVMRARPISAQDERRAVGGDVTFECAAQPAPRRSARPSLPSCDTVSPHPRR